MRINYVLIDYENVQPSDIEMLKNKPFKLKVFLGPKQSKLPVSLVTTMQSLGSDAEYIMLKTAGTNALDFHIAYYIGVLSTENKDAFFHIISKDTGFDPLINYLKEKKIFVNRSVCIGDIPVCKLPFLAENAEKSALHKEKIINKIELIVKDLIRRKASKPRTRKTLLSSINALFNKEIKERELELLFNTLCKHGIVKLDADGLKVSYNLPEKV